MNILSLLSSGRISSLPLPVKAGGGLAGFGVILAVAYILFRGNSTALAIITIGVFIIVGLLLLYRSILKLMEKRKANPLSMGIAGNAAAAPQGVSEPARRARLDDLRRNFEQGVEKFRAAGKNLYSVPWYVLVGEPGSGKTEAIRHCNVGFPPGLQDQLQGAGGTLNMNWWFTNQAIILDTAGRLMFEEVVPGSTNEWAEFLKLLKNNRPNSPVNGLLLVIPVDTLIKDSADQIEKKATKIAQQFDQIQRTLGVRFPVFVIITKCDLLNGFREFFDNLNDPQLQHQIMGWSNPASLDERFDPATVVNHLETVKSRLVERRQTLLLDPVNSEDPQSRRVDQVDALYALPDSIVKIAPRLRRYLEMIFVAGEWSPKPLFLRGIYFTSSMTEGSALDAELAEVLGVPVDSLPEGRVWRRDRAYFLRDLFVEKVFREKGLVTRATNADKQQRTRRAVVLAFGFLGVLLLLGATVWESKSLDKNIGGPRDFWTTAAKYDPSLLSIVTRKGDSHSYDYNPQQFSIGEGTSKHDTTVGQFFGSSLSAIQSNIKIPPIFKPMAFIGGDVNGKQKEAFRALYESTVLTPVFNAVRVKMGAGEPWSPQYTQALAQLMRLEYAAAGKSAGDEKHPEVDLDPMFAVVLSADDYKKFSNDSAGLQSVADWIYTKDAGGGKWPPDLLAAGGPGSVQAIDQGVTAAIAYWSQQTGDNSDVVKNINDVRGALDKFRDAETDLQGKQALAGKITKFPEYLEFTTEWKAQFAALEKARDSAAAAWATASGGKDVKIAELYKDQRDVASKSALDAYDMLLRYTVEVTANTDPGTLKPSTAALASARGKLEAAEKSLKDWASAPDAAATLKDLASLDANYLSSIKGTDGNTHHRFEVDAQLYETADKMLVAKAAGGDPLIAPTASLDDAFAKTDKDYSDASDNVGRLAILATGPDDTLTKAISLTQFVLDASGRARKDLLADQILSGYPKNAQEWPAAIAALAKTAPRDNLQRPQVPLVTFPAGQDKTFDEQYSPDAAGIVADRLATIAHASAAQDDKGGAARILDAADLSSRAAAAQKSFGGYRDVYVQYWRDGVKEQLVFNYGTFADFANKLGDTTESAVYEQLKAYGDRMVYALNRVGATDEANAVKLAPAIVREECKTALSSWTNLGTDPLQARSAILGYQANDFKDNFTVPSAKSSDSYAARYWQALPVALLRTLVVDGQKQIQTALTALARYQRFPLAPPGDKKDDLTLDDVLNARKALEQIRGAGAAAAPAAGGVALAPGAKPIGQGGMTQVREVDAQLDLLRGGNLLKDKQAYFDQLDKFFLGLPVDNKPLTVTLTVAKDKLKNVDMPISAPFTYMAIYQKDSSGKEKQLKDSTLNSADQVDTCTIEYPAGDLELKFRNIPTGDPLLVQTIPGNWAVLRLLHDAKSVSRDGNKWTVEYPITTAEKKTYSLFLTVEFKQPIPDLADWPKPPGS